MTQWTDDRVALLTRLWNEEMPGSAIAERLGQGFSRGAVIAKAARLKLPGRLNPISTEDEKFEHALNLIVNAPKYAPVTIQRAAHIVQMPEKRLQDLWDQRVEATHGGEPL